MSELHCDKAQRPSGDACGASVLLGMGGSVLEAEGNAAG